MDWRDSKGRKSRSIRLSGAEYSALARKERVLSAMTYRMLVSALSANCRTTFSEIHNKTTAKVQKVTPASGLLRSP